MDEVSEQDILGSSPLAVVASSRRDRIRGLERALSISPIVQVGSRFVRGRLRADWLTGGQSPNAFSSRAAAPAQSRFASGFAGLG